MTPGTFVSKDLQEGGFGRVANCHRIRNRGLVQSACGLFKIAFTDDPVSIIHASRVCSLSPQSLLNDLQRVSTKDQIVREDLRNAVNILCPDRELDCQVAAIGCVR